MNVGDLVKHLDSSVGLVLQIINWKNGNSGLCEVLWFNGNKISWSNMNSLLVIS